MISIVVAEDQALVLGALATLLDLEDDLTVVGRAGDGNSALALIDRLRPDILVSDIEMPGLTGLELADRLAKANSPAKVIIVTTFGRPGYLRRAMDAGVCGYLLKDSPAADLVAAVRRVAGGGKAISAELATLAWDAEVDPMTERERAVLRLAAEGRSNKEIAATLQLSPGTVRNYLSEVSVKLDASNRLEAGRIARDMGWL